MVSHYTFLIYSTIVSKWAAPPFRSIVCFMTVCTCSESSESCLVLRDRKSLVVGVFLVTDSASSESWKPSFEESSSSEEEL